jgi:GntR family transcriptional regulator
VISFRLSFRPGISLYEQVVYAATKAIISGQLRPGDAFPSVRALSKELKINPNTAHKVVAQLVTQGLLETRPGIGTVVAQLPESTRRERAQLLNQQIEELLVEARKLGITFQEILESITAQWKRLGGADAEPSDPQLNAGGRRK